MALIFGKIASVLLIIFVGFGANKLNVLPSEIEPHLNKMLFYIIIPGMIYTTIATREFTPDLASMTAQAVLLDVLFMALFVLLAYAVYRLVYGKEKNPDKGVYIGAFASLNTALIGFPISQALFGDLVLYILVLINLAMTLYVFLVMPSIMNAGLPKTGEKKDRKFIDRMKTIIKPIINPAPISVFISLAMLFAGVRFPAFIEECLNIIGSGTTVVSMLIVGIQLGRSDIREVMKKMREVIFYALKLIIMPVIVFFLIDPTPLPTEIKIGFIFAATLPSGVTPAPLASQQGLDPTPAAEGIVITCIISIAVMSVVSMFLTAHYGLI